MDYSKCKYPSQKKRKKRTCGLPTMHTCGVHILGVSLVVHHDNQSDGSRRVHGSIFTRAIACTSSFKGSSRMETNEMSVLDR